MPKKWTDIIQDDRYKNASEETKKQIKESYWSNVVEKKPEFKQLEDSNKNLLKDKFLGEESLRSTVMEVEPKGTIQEADKSPQAGFRQWLLSNKAGNPSVPPVEMLKSFVTQPQDGASEFARSAILAGANSAAAGVPGMVLKDLSGLKQPFNMQNKVGETLGNIAGSTMGAPAKLAGLATKNMAVNTVPQNILKGATQGALTGAMVPPSGPSTIPQELMQRAGQATAGAGIGAFVGSINGLLKSGKTDVLANNAEYFRNELSRRESNLHNWYGNRVNQVISKNPDRLVDNSKTAYNISQSISKNELPYGVNKAIKQIPSLGNMVKNPETAQISASESQNIIRKLKPMAYKINNKGRITGVKDPDVVNLLNEVRNNQNTAFPELNVINKKYAEYVNPIKDMKPKFEAMKELPFIKSDSFKEPETYKRLTKAFGEPLVKEMEKLRGVMRKKDFVDYFTKRLMYGAAAGGVAGLAGGLGLRLTGRGE